MSPTSSAVTLTIPAGAVVDRVVLREDQTHGEQIFAYTVAVSGEPTAAIVGQSIGNRFIGMLPSAVTGPVTITVNITDAAGPTVLREVSAYNCSRTPTNGGCSYVHDFAYKIVASITVVAQKVPSVKACCSLCAAHDECAVFVYDTATLCTVMSANQGGGSQVGTISGSPL